MNLKINSIEINGFRGIPQKLTLDFRPQGNTEPASMILAGDNGVGKSSIVDAFEFALQYSYDHASVISLSKEYPQNCYVRIRFSNGSSVTRSAVEVPGKTNLTECLYENPTNAFASKQNRHPDFAISPFVLRREDILKFWTVQDKQRKTVFLGYLRRKYVETDPADTRVPKRKHDIASIGRFIKKVSVGITNAFTRISPARSFVKSVEVHKGGSGDAELSFRANLINGKSVHPVQVFSEANLDLLAMIIFLEFAKESAERGQAKFLILDDVLQSVDAAVRVLVTEYILDEFRDWQIIFTIHDRLWLEQLRILFQRRNKPFLESEIIRWSFDSGPFLIAENKDLSTSLEDALTKGDVTAICAQAGFLLERISNTLSYSLPIAVTRRKGDKYTLGDLWPGVFKTLSKTDCARIVENVNRWMHLRNLAGAHFNEWAQSLSVQESQLFGEAVIQLLNEVRCDECHRWIERKDGTNGSQPIWTCQCRRKKLSTGSQSSP